MNQAPHWYQEADSQHVTYMTVLLSQIVLLIISQTKITDSMSFAIVPLPHSSSHGAVSIMSLQSLIDKQEKLILLYKIKTQENVREKDYSQIIQVAQEREICRSGR